MVITIDDQELSNVINLLRKAADTLYYEGNCITSTLDDQADYLESILTEQYADANGTI